MQKIEISHRTIIFAVFFLILLNFLWVIKDLVFSLFVAFIVMSALKPFVDFLVKKRVPRGLGVAFIYLLFIAFLFMALFVIFPPLILESTNLFRNLPGIFEGISPTILDNFNFDQFANILPNITNQFLGIFKSVFSNAIFTITTLFFGFYFLLQDDLVKKSLFNFFKEDQIKSVSDIYDKVEKRMSAWFWGELVLMLAVGIMTFAGLNLIGMKYALALAVLAGLLEVIPNLGPTISAIPAILIGLSHSYLLGITALVLYFVIQQLENNLVVPLVMKKAVGLNPIITLIALIIGGRIAGVLGVILAIPTTLFLEVLFLEIVKKKQTVEAS